MDTWQLISQVGPTGLVSMALVFMVNEHRKRVTEYAALQEKYNALQEKRVEEANKNSGAMLTLYEKVEKLVDQIQELRK